MTASTPTPSEEQRRRLAKRLAMRVHDRGDEGQELPRTRAALTVQAHEDGGAARLEALVAALSRERVILPVSIEADPRISGVHAQGEQDIDFVRAHTPVGEVLAVFTSAQALNRARPGNRPMGTDMRRVALSALVETRGRIVVDPLSRDIIIPRPATAALAQGDEWLPAWKDVELRGAVLEAGRSSCPALEEVQITYAGEGRTRILLDIRAHEVGAQLRVSVERALADIAALPRLVAAADDMELVPVLKR